jgi:antitoxin HicB
MSSGRAGLLIFDSRWRRHIVIIPLLAGVAGAFPPLFSGFRCEWRSDLVEGAMLTYSLKLAPNYDGMVLATFPDVPEAFALGRDDEEAVEQARCALEAALERYVAEGRALPVPRSRSSLQVTTERFDDMATA